MKKFEGLKNMLAQGSKLVAEKSKAVESLQEAYNTNTASEEKVIADTEKSIQETKKLLDLTDFEQEQKIRDGMAGQLNSLESLLTASQAKVEEGKGELNELTRE